MENQNNVHIGIINKLATKIAQLEVYKSELEVIVENLQKENEELKKQLDKDNEK